MAKLEPTQTVIKNCLYFPVNDLITQVEIHDKQFSIPLK
jgi:hypothetical protein